MLNGEMRQFQELRLENERLRTQNGHLTEENEKLRLLVRGLDFCTQNYGCGCYGDDNEWHTCPLRDEAGCQRCDEMLEELGFEVN